MPNEGSAAQSTDIADDIDPVAEGASSATAPQCTACGESPLAGSAVLVEHPELPNKLLCARCHSRVSREFDVDADGFELQCRWCGVGGDMVGCDSCVSAFCRGCVIRNFDEEMLESVLTDPNWKCFRC
eukprot:SAG31_NODE_20379_length_576_cov_1.079665_1_plen_127_part_01